MAQLPDQSKVLARRQRLVDGGRLTGQPDRWPKQVGLPHDIEAEHPRATRIGQQRCGKDAHERRLARTVWTEEPKHRSARDGHLNTS
jgi:hypothetical protein